MRSARFITSEGEERSIMSGEDDPPGRLGVVLVGIPAGDRGAIERYVERGYDVLVAPVEPEADVTAGLAALRSAMAALAARTENVAVVGYGFGGKYAFLAVTRLGAAAAGALRGAGIGAHLDESARAKKPLSFHFADDDVAVPFTEVRAIKGALEGFGTTEIYRYPTLGAETMLQAERRVFAVLDSLR
jgi:dienelactone hydrolase